MDPRLVADRYQLGDTLHQGESTTVFRALDVNLRREVAVKVLNRGDAGDHERVRRFLDTARSMSALSHSNIVATYDVGISGDTPYTVQELVEGKTLLDVVGEEAPLRPDRVRRLGAQLASAIGYAEQYYGRDCSVDMADVVVVPGDRIRVLKLHIDDPAINERDGRFPRRNGSIHEGQSQIVAPARSSVYALGSTLYQMATGRAPKDEGLSPTTFRKDREHSSITPPSFVNPAISPSLERIILGALETGAGRWYQSVSEVGSALQPRENGTHGIPEPEGYGRPRSPRDPVPSSTYGAPLPAARGNVLVSVLILALLLVAAVFAATTFAPRLLARGAPSVAGAVNGSDLQRERQLQNVQGPVTDLKKAITQVQNDTQTLNGSLSDVRDKLAVETSIVNAMQTLSDEMRTDASQRPVNPAQMASLAAKKQSMQLSYASLKSATSNFDTAAKTLENSLPPMDSDATAAQTAADNLRIALAQNPLAGATQPAPGDEQAAISQYQSTATQARNDLANMRSTEAGLLQTANSLVQQGAAAAAVKTAPVATSTQTPGTPTPGPSATPQPGATPIQGVAGQPRTQQPTASASPAPTPTPRPTRQAPVGPWRFSPVFQAFADQIPDVVGQPTGNPSVDPDTGNTTQPTTGGLMVWKKATGRVYFTDGNTTWVLGPNGLQSRPNDQRFPWEGTPTPAPTPTPPASTPQPAPALPQSRG